MPEDAKNYGTMSPVGAGFKPVNWVTLGKVNAIKDQKQCGSCWAFSSNCALESEWAIKYGTLYSLSEQQLVSCDTSCYGCSGGW